MKLFVSDLDGTLLNNQFSISDENIEALKFAKLKGVEIAIASGRTYQDIVDICKRHSLKPYIISNNGACAYSKDGELIFCKSIIKNETKKILEFMEDNKVCYEVLTSKEIYIPKDWEERLDNEILENRNKEKLIEEETLEHVKEELLSQVGIIEISSYEEFFKVNRICFTISILSFSDEIHKKITDYINGFEDLMIIPSGRYTQEIMSKDASKGETLLFLANLLNIPKKEIVAIGDNLNDKTMVNKAGIGIAVENGVEGLKKVCDFVTKSNEENGVAEAIYKLIG